MITISASAVFSAAHRLYPCTDKEARLHGHSFTVSLSVGFPGIVGREVNSPDPITVCSQNRLEGLLGDICQHYDHRVVLSKHDPLLGEFQRLLPESLVVSHYGSPTLEALSQEILVELYPVIRAIVSPRVAEVTVRVSTDVGFAESSR